MRNEYISPLMAKAKAVGAAGNGNNKITLDVLRKEIPTVQQGLAAQEELDTTNPTPERKKLLAAKILAGERAKETLYLLAIPLIHRIALAEYRKRQAWNSRITLEDLMADGMSGFMRGIKAYKPDNGQTSPTNYLGQWIQLDMRRGADYMDQDFNVPGEAVERHRKIRAIRSRLTSELGRTPTPQEIVDAAKDKTYTTNMMGRKAETKAKEAKTSTNRRAITIKHVLEEQENRHRAGTIPTTTYLFADDKEHNLDNLGVTSLVGQEHQPNHNQTHVDNNSAQQALSQTLEDLFIKLGIHHNQTEIIRARWGLVPYEEPVTIKEISATTGVAKHKIDRILSVFSTELTTKNATFHHMISTMHPDEIYAMNIQWVWKKLGAYTPPTITEPHKELTDPTYAQPTNNTPPQPASLNINRAGGTLAQFHCQQENITYTIAYGDKNSVPMTRHCPTCGAKATRVP